MTLRVRGIVGLLAAALVLAGCTGSDEKSDTTPRSAGGLHLAPACPPASAPHRKPTVDQLNKLGASIDLPGWQAGDIGASGRLSDGRLVWLFGDTTRSQLEPPIVANSMLVSSGRCVSQLVDARSGPVIPDVSSNVVRWPMSVAIGRQGGHDVIVVLCSRIDRGQSGSFGFTFLGTSAAVFTVKDGEAPQLLKVVDITADSSDEDQVNWGAAVTLDAGWYLVYGTRLTGQDYDFGRELYVARTPAADPGNRARWQFWDGSRWQSHVGQARAVLSSQGGVSQTLSVDRLGDGFVAVSKRNGDVGNFVYEWRSPDPWGPWTASKALRAPGGFDTGNLEYAPLAHPEIALRSGDLLVSISRNTTDLQRLLEDPQLGRPTFVQVSR